MLTLWRPLRPPGAVLALLATILHTNGTARRLWRHAKSCASAVAGTFGHEDPHALLSAHPSQALDAVFIPAMTESTTSRVCVKSIPKHCDERRLRQHFEADASLEVTDVKVMRTKEGKPRQFGFVGFRSAEAAERARQAFDRSFIDTSRIAIESAFAFGDDALLHRPWSKHSKGSSAYARAHPEEAPPPAEEPSATKPKKKKAPPDATAAAAAADPKAEFLR